MAAVQVQPAIAARSGKLRWLLAQAWVLSLVLASSGCVAPGTPVVTDRSVTKASGGTYIVKKGDTLYSIAWRFDLDHQRLAAANNIGAPFTIYPGQRLRLREQSPRKPVNISADQNAGSRQTAQRAKQPKPQTESGARDQAQTSSKNEPARSTSRKTVSARSVVKASNPETGTSASSKRGDTAWHRPLPKKPDVPFGANNKGLDYTIRSRAGVAAAHSGKVVYAGNGIAGFERLIIVQHSSDLLSAYSFNGKMLVSEQQRVSGGAEIAQILPRPGVGQTLHFELRRKGQPINPQTLIP